MLFDSARTPSGLYSFTRKQSFKQSDQVSIPASSAVTSVIGTPIVLALANGQGIQIRDASCDASDDDGTKHLSLKSIGIALFGPDPTDNICARGYPLGADRLMGPASGAHTCLMGFSDWPFVAWDDFPQFGALAPNLRLMVQANVANNDAGAAHNADVTLTVFYEVWQLDASASSGLTGQQRINRDAQGNFIP